MVSRSGKIRVGFFCEKGIGRSWAFHESLRSITTDLKLRRAIIRPELLERLDRLGVFSKLRSFHGGVDNFEPESSHYPVGRSRFFGISKTGVINKPLNFFDYIVPVAREAEDHFNERYETLTQRPLPVIIVPSQRRISNLYEAVSYVLEKIADHLEDSNPGRKIFP